MKFQILRAIRATGLLGVADACKFRLGQARTRVRNQRFGREFPDFPTPPQHLAFDALNHVDWYSYRESGLAHAGVFARVIREAFSGDGPLDVLEWGCGPGRLVRHMPSLLGARAHSITGSDYNGESISWCRRNLPGIRFVDNDLNPPLPFAEATFDAVYNFSVFTHLSVAVQLEWTKELVRVLRPGGLLVCTTHGDAYRYLLASRDERERFDAGEPVVQGNYAEGRKWFFALHPERFVRDRLLAGMADVRRYPTAESDHILQDVWTARRPAA
jgi:SAM-dependent methyltransferase